MAVYEYSTPDGYRVIVSDGGDHTDPLNDSIRVSIIRLVESPVRKVIALGGDGKWRERAEGTSLEPTFTLPRHAWEAFSGAVMKAAAAAAAERVAPAAAIRPAPRADSEIRGENSVLRQWNETLQSRLDELHRMIVQGELIPAGTVAPPKFALPANTIAPGLESIRRDMMADLARAADKRMQEEIKTP